MSDSSTRFKALFFHLCPQSWAPSRFSINVHWINKTGEEVRKEHLYITSHSDYWGLPSKLSDKESACGAGAIVDTVSICGSGRSSGEVNGNPLQYSCLENLMDMGSQRVGHNWATSLSLSPQNCQAISWLNLTPWRRWQLVPVLCDELQSISPHLPSYKPLSNPQCRQ